MHSINNTIAYVFINGKVFITFKIFNYHTASQIKFKTFFLSWYLKIKIWTVFLGL